MILKNNRFFGRDISNMPQNLSRNQSQELCEKRIRKHSMSLVEPTKPSLANMENKIFSKDITAMDIDILPLSISSSDRCVP